MGGLWIVPPEDKGRLSCCIKAWFIVILRVLGGSPLYVALGARSCARGMGWLLKADSCWFGGGGEEAFPEAWKVHRDSRNSSGLHRRFLGQGDGPLLEGPYQLEAGPA